MIPSSTLRFQDLSQQKRFSVSLGDDLTLGHDVDQAIALFLDQTGIPHHDLEWAAYSRGVRLDKRSRIGDLADEDTEWTVLPTVSAGNR